MIAIFTATFLACLAVLMNLASAGAAALLYLKRPRTSRGRRNVLAICLPAVIPALLFVGIGSVSGSVEGAVNWVLVTTMLIIGGGCALVAIPGAIVMSRMVERGPGVGDTFT